jgi:F-type H+-transporting ATPase subunit b
MYGKLAIDCPSNVGIGDAVVFLRRRICLILLLAVGGACIPDAASAAASAEHGHGDHIGHANADADLENPAEFKKSLALWSLIVFLILMAILGKFAWGPIVAGLEKREARIAENIASAERAAEDARRLIADYEAKLAGAADQVRAMLDEARRDAEHTKDQIIAEAKAAAQLEHDRQMRELRTATDQALKMLSETFADQAVDLAGRIIREKLNAKDHDRLVKEAVAKFAQSPSVN